MNSFFARADRELNSSLFYAANAAFRASHGPQTFGNGNGTDTYGFAALPAGCANGSSVGYVGDGTFFWTATSSEGGRDLDYSDDGLFCDLYDKGIGQSVRCLRN